MQKENQRIALTKRLLQEALLRLLEQMPLEKISITQLCNEAGINRATFYRHYSVPADVLLQMQMDFTAQLQNRHPLGEIVNFSAYVEGILTDLYQHADLIRVFLRNNATADLVHMINYSLQFIIDRYAAPDADTDNARLLCAFLTGGGFYMLHQWLMGDVQKTPAQITELIMGFAKHLSSKSNL